MMLTTTTMKRGQLQVKETILKVTRKALNIAKDTGEIALLFIGYVDDQKYKDIIQTKYNRE